MISKHQFGMDGEKISEEPKVRPIHVRCQQPMACQTYRPARNQRHARECYV